MRVSFRSSSLEVASSPLADIGDVVLSLICGGICFVLLTACAHACAYSLFPADVTENCDALIGRQSIGVQPLKSSGYYYRALNLLYLPRYTDHTFIITIVKKPHDVYSM